jgi:enolase
MATIKSITAREIIDSKANPTIEATVILDDGSIGTAGCPSGTSVGKYEAHELRDGDLKRFNGKGVLKAIDNVHALIAPALMGMDILDQQGIDRKMISLDATPNKAKLGANATLAVSMAAMKAGAARSKLPLYRYIQEFIPEAPTPKIPTPMFNVLNGGKHAGNNVNIQEFLAIPATFKTYSEALLIGVAVYHSLMTTLSKNFLSTLIGDEGGFAPALTTNQDALSLLSQAVDTTGLRLGYDVFGGMDCASDTYFIDGKYKIKDRPNPLTAPELVLYYEEMVKKYNILYLEDGLAEDDLEGWKLMNEKLGHNTMIVGDDLTATNPDRLQLALDKIAITGIIIKPNQIGTVIETLAVVAIAKQAGLKVIVSHRSGETNDDFIADLGVAVAADYMKCGAPARGERVAKYNRLLKIEQDLKVQ